MSHYLYKTKGLILKKRDCGESGKIYSFFTEEYGRIEVFAQGVRFLKSKLRYSLDKVSLVRVCFIGAAGDLWKLVDAGEEIALSKTRGDFNKLQTAAIIFNFIDRLVRGQEADNFLWTIIEESLLFLENNDFTKDSLKDFELLTKLRVLAQLGYVGDCDKAKYLSLNSFFSRDSLILAINRALKESQL
ncbi:MAG: DNA repair protein RecO [bacterium]|nr:DNA repair protein RecO [bacterium]